MMTPEEIMLKAIADLPGSALPPWPVIINRQIIALDAAGYAIIRTGKYMTPLANRLAAFEEKYTPEPNSSCWLWTAAMNSHGYGRFQTIAGDAAHQFSYAWYHGPVPKGMEIDHLCRVRTCVNPDHLEAVTKQENAFCSNSVAGLNARKTNCNRGHPLSGTNLIKRPKGWRRCRTCQKESAKKHRDKKKAALAG